jgi:hypothetical protein
MPKPNTQFELDVDDIELIESTLRSQLNTENTERKRLIQEMLAKLHHQKNWYRPKDKPYISG